MDQRSPAFEATLLYKMPPRLDLRRLECVLGDMLEAHGSMLLSTEALEPGFVLFSCDTVQIVLAVTDRPLPVAHFLSAGRPDTATVAEQYLLDELVAHRLCATVLVMDAEAPDGRTCPVPDVVKRRICWELTTHLNGATGADMVFWCETDTLYTGVEFAKARIFATARAGAGAARLPDILPPEMDEPAAARGFGGRLAAWFWDEPAEAGYPFDDVGPRDRRALEALLSVAVPNVVALHLDDWRERLDGRRAMQFAAMACSTATMGLSTLHNMPGLLG